MYFQGLDTEILYQPYHSSDLLIECMTQSEVYTLPMYVFYFVNGSLSTNPLGTYSSFMAMFG